MTHERKYPDITVLVGRDRDAFATLSQVIGALRRAGCEQAVIDEFLKEVVSSNYTHLLKTCTRWVNVC